MTNQKKRANFIILKLWFIIINNGLSLNVYTTSLIKDAFKIFKPFI